MQEQLIDEMRSGNHRANINLDKVCYEGKRAERQIRTTTSIKYCLRLRAACYELLLCDATGWKVELTSNNTDDT